MDSMIETGIRKFKNILPRESYGRREIKKAIIVGRMFRIHSSTSEECDIFWQGWITIIELLQLGYSRRLIDDCCRWTDARFKTNIWESLLKVFQMVGNYFMFPALQFQVEG